MSLLALLALLFFAFPFSVFAVLAAVAFSRVPRLDANVDLREMETNFMATKTTSNEPYF